MNSLERFEAALRLEKPDRVPLAYLFFGAGHCVLHELGMSVKDAYYSAEGIVRAQLKAREMFGHDNVMSPWGCMTVEAEALGSKIQAHEMSYPEITKHALEEPGDADHLKVPDPLTDGRMPMVLDSLKALMRAVGNDAAVVGFMCSPFTILDGIRGMSDAGIDMLMDPDRLKKVLEVATSTCIAYGQAMVNTGVQTILVKDGFAGADMMSREHCLEFDMKYLGPVITALQDCGAKVIIGNVSGKPYLDMQIALKPNAICFASGDIGEVKRAFGKQVCVMGNVDQTRMPSCNAADIEKEATICIEKARDKGGHILCTGCEIPMETPLANVKALIAAIERSGDY